MNFLFGEHFKTTRLVVVAAGIALGVGAQADSFSLTVQGTNQNTSDYIYPLNKDVDISSFHGTLKDLTTSSSVSLGEFFCVDTADSINPPTTYGVTEVAASGNYAVAASLVSDFSAGYPGPVFNGNSADLSTLNHDLGYTASSTQLDAGLQLAIWETVNGISSSGSGTLNTIAGKMISINAGTKDTSGVELQNIGGDGQSMLYVPGFGAPTPSPEPFTMAIGAAGIGMYLVRRKRAK